MHGAACLVAGSAFRPEHKRQHLWNTPETLLKGSQYGNSGVCTRA